MNNTFNQQFADVTEKMKQLVPQVSFNKNGYEIRAQMLEMAQQQLWQDYHAKWGAFETSISKSGNEVIAKIDMPMVPGVEQVLDAAEKFYSFVNQNTKK